MNIFQLLIRSVVERGICPTAKSTMTNCSYNMAGCIAHARNDHISTSALKSHVTVAFLTPISFKTRKFRLFSHK